MKIPNPLLASRPPRGVALIITLLMVSLLAFLVVAFFARTTNNRQIESATKGGVRAEILARGGAEAVIADLKAEIVAGSEPVTASANRPVYIPIKNSNGVSFTAVPSRVLADPSMTTPSWAKVYTNLVKQSKGPFFDTTSPLFSSSGVKPMINATTSVTTDVFSLNGRNVYYARWSKPELAAAAYPFSPANGIHLPRWIMVTREGFPDTAQKWSDDLKNLAADNPKAAVGRFAFNVYDTGGLLDLNAAGYPPAAPTNLTAAEIQELKGTITGADLSQIPGVLDVTKFTTTWKYLASKGAGSFMPQWRTTAQNGFLRPGTGDNITLGRQDLIRFAKKTADTKATGAPEYGIDGYWDDDTPSVLPFTTHFSRASNAPGWFPTTPANSTVNYAALAKSPSPATSTAVNRILPAVRAGGTWTRLTGEASASDEPLIKYRFPLSWLALLEDGIPTTAKFEPSVAALKITTDFDARRQANGGPSAAIPNIPPLTKTEWLIKEAFGLRWNEPNNRWDYTGGGSATGVATKINTLSDVVALNREPNFFELIKAGILSGSLGNSSDFESFSTTIGEDSSADYQVIQIGANIIDQADADSFPTRIAFGFEMDSPPSIIAAKSTSNAPTSTGEVKVFAGVEDLPYLQTVLFTPYRIPDQNFNLDTSSPDPKQNATRDYINAFAQFVVWKPQQATPNNGGPTQFQVRYTGGGMTFAYFGSSTMPTEFPVGSGVKYGPRYSSPSLQSNTTFTFSDSASFRVPTLLSGTSNVAQGSGRNPRGGGALPSGMWLGETLRPERIYTSGSPNKLAPTTTHCEWRCAPTNDSRFELQYQDATGTWRTYQRFDRFGVGTGGYFRGRGLYGFADGSDGTGGIPPAGNPAGIPNQYPHYTALDAPVRAVSVADPRTQRFGLMPMYLETGARISTVPANDWRYYLKQGWWPSGSDTPYLAAYQPTSGGRFSPSWPNGTVGNPWQAQPATGNPVTDATKLWADNPGSGNNNSIFYLDPDGISRRGDGETTNGVKPMQLTTNANGTAAPNTAAMGLVMNRAFRSVGELSYVFRDVPWKTLDFSSAKSADAGLLDLFSVNEQPAVSGGKVNLNTRNAVVLQAVMSNALREEATATNLVQPIAGGASSAKAMADAMVLNTQNTSGDPNTGPILNVADLVNRLPVILPVSNANDQALKSRREVVGRALAGAGQANTWNLMVDVVAQSGRNPLTATKLEQFLVEGEKRFWLHVAIDRLTGQVIDQQLESVTE